MITPTITLTTDFGEGSPYVAAMKGVILDIQPQVRILDLSHRIPPQDILHAAFFLAESVPFFPEGVVHVVVVDPGVGTQRNLVYAEVGSHRLLAPDNGVLTLLARSAPPRRLIRLNEPRYWRSAVSHTFHGRDILAPVAAHLCGGLDPSALGPISPNLTLYPVPGPQRHGDRIDGEVLFVDDFGNLITNIPSESLPAEGPAGLTVQGQPVGRWVRTYGEASPGEVVSLVGSGGWLEVAVVQGNAAQRLGIRRGAGVCVRLPSQP